MKMNVAVWEKYDHLRENILRMGQAVVAFSGGVDSTFLLKVVHDVLGDRVLAVTASLHSHPDWDVQDARQFTGQNGIRHVWLDIDELDIPGFAENPPDRCYLCKKVIMGNIIETARKNGMQRILEGSNVDDGGDYRPGMRAVGELGVESPLLDAGLTKNEIRALSRELGLSTWNKPSCACLSSRFVYGERITREKLAMVQEAEDYIHVLGFRQVRVRVHGELARIEIDNVDRERMLCPETLDAVERELKKIGFRYVSLDLTGYRTGSMNEILSK